MHEAAAKDEEVEAKSKVKEKEKKENEKELLEILLEIVTYWFSFSLYQTNHLLSRSCPVGPTPF